MCGLSLKTFSLDRAAGRRTETLVAVFQTCRERLIVAALALQDARHAEAVIRF